MQNYTARAYAKINLSLDITGKRFDDYHTISSVMQSIDLYDEVSVTMTNCQNAPEITCSDPSVPCDTRNTAYKAAKLILEYAHSYRSCKIHIKKSIPTQAGLGGASADAAAVMKCLNFMLNLTLKEEEMMRIATVIGADVPFAIFETTALCTGIGEIITPLPMLTKHHVVIVKPEFGISTPEAYRLFDEKKIITHNSTPRVVEAIRGKKDFYHLMSNDFEDVIQREEIGNIKSKLLGHRALCAQMSGSGSAIFGLFKDERDARRAYNTLSEEYKCYLTTTR